MCLLFLHLNPKPLKPNDFTLILMSIRDEYYDRPTEFCHSWPDMPSIFGGRDTQFGGGGTWLAINKYKAKIGVILNILQPKNKLDKNKRSRGFIVTDYLTSELTDEQYIRKLSNEGNCYNGFTFVGINLNSFNASFYSNTTATNNTHLPAGTHCFGNSSKPNDLWPRAVYGKQKFEELIKLYGKVDLKQNLIDGLFKMMEDKTRLALSEQMAKQGQDLPLDFLLSASYLLIENIRYRYGTRTITIILSDKEKNVDFIEKSLQIPASSENPSPKHTFDYPGMKHTLDFPGPKYFADSPTAKNIPDNQTTKPTADSTSAKPTAENPSAKPTAENPSAKPTADNPKSKYTADSSSAKPTADNPKSKYTADNPSAKPTADSSSAKPTADNPKSKYTADNPSAKPTADNPKSKYTADNPSAKPTTDNPKSKYTADNPSAKPTADNPKSKYTADNPSAKPAADNPKSKYTADNPKLKHSIDQKTKRSADTPSKQNPENPSSKQNQENPSSKQNPENPSSKQNPENLSAKYMPENLSAKYMPENLSAKYMPENLSAKYMPENLSAKQNPDNPSAKQNPDNTSVKQNPDNQSAKQNPDNLSEKQITEEPSYKNHPDFLGLRGTPYFKHIRPKQNIAKWTITRRTFHFNNLSSPYDPD